MLNGDNADRGLIRTTAPATTRGGGDTLLGAYKFVVAAVLATVFLTTINNMSTLTSHFGNGSEERPSLASKSFHKQGPLAVSSDNSMSGTAEPDKLELRTFGDSSEPNQWEEDDPDGMNQAEPTAVETETADVAKKEADTDEEDTANKPKKKTKKNKNKNNKNKKNSEATSAMVVDVMNARKRLVMNLRKLYGKQGFDKIFLYREDTDESSVEWDDVVMPKRNAIRYRPIRALGPKDLQRTKFWGEDSNEMKDYRLRSDPKYWNSVENLRRKMMIKILLAKKHGQGMSKKDKDKDKNKPTTKYIWATGGHSAAAGHGNFFDETYTKVMEAAAQPIFAAAGLELEARNYAMGATSSASEMSMCFKEIYGDDVDVFSWDFSMLEARGYQASRLLHYATRGFLSNQQPHGVVPAFVGIQDVDESRRAAMIMMHDAYRGSGSYADHTLAENNGLALFLNDISYWKIMTDAIPDTADKTSPEIDAMRVNVRYYKCGDALEKGDPFCGENKYTEEICPNRQGKANWHPGWKHHALLGNAMALFLTDALNEAAYAIAEYHVDNEDDADLEELLNDLLAEEELMKERVVQATTEELPASFERIYWYNNTNDNWDKYNEVEDYLENEASSEFKKRFGMLDLEALFRGPSICHTARLPAQTRFYGTVLNRPRPEPAVQAIFGKEDYYVGIDEKEHHDNVEGSTRTSSDHPKPMQLVTIGKERETECGDRLVKPDYHDHWTAETKEHWTILTFPNAAEQDKYKYHQYEKDYKGILVMVHRFGAFGEYEKGFMGPAEYAEGKWVMRVNGVKVTAMTLIGHEAILLEHKNGLSFDRNEEGRYDIEIKVNEPDGFAKISAFIMF